MTRRQRRQVLRSGRSMANTDWPVNLIAVAVIASAGPVAAHPEYASATVNRYLEVDLVAPDRMRLALQPGGQGPPMT